MDSICKLVNVTDDEKQTCIVKHTILIYMYISIFWFCELMITLVFIGLVSEVNCFLWWHPLPIHCPVHACTIMSTWNIIILHIERLINNLACRLQKYVTIGNFFQKHVKKCRHEDTSVNLSDNFVNLSDIILLTQQIIISSWQIFWLLTYASLWTFLFIVINELKI